MGVAGSGKSTVGQALARALGWPFFDGEDLHHHQSNVDKIKSGIPLNDEDRWPWLERLNQLIFAELARDRSWYWLAPRSSKAIRISRLAAIAWWTLFISGQFRSHLFPHEILPSPYMRAELLPSEEIATTIASILKSDSA